MCTNPTKKTWKLSPKAKSRALELSLQGISVKAVAAQISEEFGQTVSFQAIWQFRARNAAKLQVSLKDEIERAIALSPLATLENRLLKLEAVIAIAFDGNDWLMKQIKDPEITPQERMECARALQHTYSALPIVLQAIKTADDAVFRVKNLEASMKRQIAKKSGGDRADVEQAILKIQKRGVPQL